QPALHLSRRTLPTIAPARITTFAGGLRADARANDRSGSNRRNLARSKYFQGFPEAGADQASRPVRFVPIAPITGLQRRASLPLHAGRAAQPSDSLHGGGLQS